MTTARSHIEPVGRSSRGLRRRDAVQPGHPDRLSMPAE